MSTIKTNEVTQFGLTIATQNILDKQTLAYCRGGFSVRESAQIAHKAIMADNPTFDKIDTDTAKWIYADCGVKDIISDFADCKIAEGKLIKKNKKQFVYAYGKRFMTYLKRTDADWKEIDVKQKEACRKAGLTSAQRKAEKAKADKAKAKKAGEAPDTPDTDIVIEADDSTYSVNVDSDEWQVSFDLLIEALLEKHDVSILMDRVASAVSK